MRKLFLSLTILFFSLSVVAQESTTFIKSYSIQPTLQGNYGTLNLVAEVEGPDKGKTKVIANILDAEGKQLSVMAAGKPYHMGVVNLWTAETPYRYHMIVKLMKGGKVLQEIATAFGMRQFTVKDGTMLFNGSAIKLKGINYSTYLKNDSVVITDKDLLTDFQLMRDANINTIRIVSCPQTERMMQICDSLGMYVICEDANINRNHPCLINDGNVQFNVVNYPVPSDLPKIASDSQLPVISMEYANAEGLDFGQMQRTVDAWYQNPKLAGGCVWQLRDNGKLSYTEESVSKNEFTKYIWLDGANYYNFDEKGPDGIVYPEGIRQTDYWQVRKVYAPVVLSLTSCTGSQAVVNVTNRYDFTDLKDVHIRWILVVDGKMTKQAIVSVPCAPHQTASMTINDISVPADALAYLSLEITDKNHIMISEQSFRLDNLSPRSIVAKLQPIAAFPYGFNAALLQNNIKVRVGKKLTISEYAAEKQDMQVWPEHLIDMSKCDIAFASKDSAVYNCEFANDTIGSISGTITVVRKSDSSCHLSYSLTPSYIGKQLNMTEVGVGLRIPHITTVRWIGNGPYASYPGKDRLAEFGVYQLNTNDLYFPGNRENTSLMFLTNDIGVGTMVYPDEPGNISVDREDGEIVVSHCAAVSEPYNFTTHPQYVDLKGEPIHGSFSLMAIGNKWSEQMTYVFGSPTNLPTSFAPYYHSYDQ